MVPENAKTSYRLSMGTGNVQSLQNAGYTHGKSVARFNCRKSKLCVRGLFE